MRRVSDLDWDRIAHEGDPGSSPEQALAQVAARPAFAAPSRHRRSRVLTILVLLGWLGWEAAGVARAVAVGPPIFEAMFRAGGLS